MIYEILSTGSKGNAVILDSEILIDCGVPWKKLKPYAGALRLVLLTHWHGDHFNPATVRKLSQDRPALRFGCCEWMAPLLLDAGVYPKNIDIYSPESPDFWGYSSIRVQVRADIVPHNVPNCAYHLRIKDERIFYVTDAGNLNGIEAKNYDLYMIEANHTEGEIWERIKKKQAAGEYAYEIEALKNHLSLEQANDFIYRNAKPTSEYVYLHQHQEREAAGNE